MAHKILTAGGSRDLIPLRAKLFDVDNPIVIICRGISVISGGLVLGWSWYGPVGGVLGAAFGFVAFYVSEK